MATREEFCFVAGGDNHAVGHQNRSPAKFGSHHLFDGREKTVHSHVNDIRFTTRAVHRPSRFERTPVLCQADGIACRGYSFGTNFHSCAHKPSGQVVRSLRPQGSAINRRQPVRESLEGNGTGATCFPFPLPQGSIANKKRKSSEICVPRYPSLSD